MKVATAFLLAIAAVFPCPALANIGFTKEDLELAKGACLVGSSFDFVTEADGSVSIKNLEGKGKLHIGNKSVDVVDLPDSDKKKEFAEIRICIRDYLIKDRTKTPADNATPDSDRSAKHPKDSKNLLSSFMTQWQKFRPQDIERNDKVRLWKRVNDHWEESYLNGTGVMYHDITNRISLNGCDGDRTVKEDDKKLEMFIPDIGCKNMTLMFNFNANGWQPFGIMGNYK
jgi:hypothetical protein